MRKSDILEIFNESYKHCMSEFKQFLTAISDYETVVDELEEKIPKVGEKELHRVLEMVSDRGKTFIDCIRYCEKKILK